MTHRLTDDEYSELARLLVWGLEAPDEIDGVPVPADYPLDVRQAARYMGLRVKRVRANLTDPRFRKMYAAECESLRSGQRARNLVAAISIRDDMGENTPADRAVRLRAIATLEGVGQGSSGVTVNVNQTNNSLTMSPGYVIKLRPTDGNAVPAPAAGPILIEGERSTEGAEHG